MKHRKTLTACVCCALLIVVVLVARQLSAPADEPVAAEAPVAEATPADWTAYAADSALTHPMGTDIAAGSCWTDGEWFYEVTQTGQTIRMEGYGLHEGGAVCAFRVADGALTTVLPAEGYTTFARPGCRVGHHLISTDDGTAIEMLVAYDDRTEAGGQPWRVLQRIGSTDEGPDFVAGLLHDMLAGRYTDAADGDSEWVFDATGRVVMPGREAAEPYRIELGYDMPTGVIRLPDGQRRAVMRTAEGLQLYRAVYDNEEDYWTGTEQLLATLTPSAADSTTWATRRPALPARFGFASTDYQLQVKHRLEGLNAPMAVLNYALLPLTDDDDEEAQP